MLAFWINSQIFGKFANPGIFTKYLQSVSPLV